ncbi:MAG: efflux RND transporter periplasmic adaptor subunit, partial [Hyphomicrobium sp.]
MSERDEYVGRFVAFDYVEVRSRVSGYLDKILFKDGQLVKAGDPLFLIDPRPFQATLEQSNAAVLQAKANLAFAESDLKRGESLRTGTTITQQALDQRLQASRVAAASVTSQEAAVKQAELDLSFTELSAPISGRIGDRRVSIGNLVSGGTAGGTTLLATIASIDPIRFEFTMDEASYLRYLRMASSSSAADRGITLPVRLKLIDEDAYAHEGKIDFVDNAID